MRALLSTTMLAGLVSLALPAQAIPVTIHYVNGSLVADATLDVEGGRAVSGTGTISGGGFIGTLPITYLSTGMAPPPLVAVPAQDCTPADAGCYNVGTFSCGCNFTDQDTVFDTASAIPVDTNGIAFQIGGSAINYGLALYDAGDGTVGEIVVGEASPQPVILNAGTPGGTLEFQVVAEPMSLAVLSVGLVGLASVRRRRM